ncbi:MAG: FadR family transcriptional regulator [Halomonas sp.]|uniref:FadR/GntR family transcriptional regulator n=1 Tax=unclassified Halomonas TaxID=2609666 RepID=UPI0009907839|nr:MULTISPECIES: FadR/GntR family transcriptional regulator [unclassified Halomonas]AVU11348.1 hypothetical protein BV504_17030 [Halomonas sp. 'Soap Lake \
MDIAKPLSDSLVNWFYRELNNGLLKPGDSLPSERELCEQFGVSRTVVREALSYLKKEGVIDTGQGKKTTVAENTHARSFKVGDFPVRDEETFQEIIDFLIFFESGAAKIAASKRDSTDLKKIQQALLGMELAIAKGELADHEDYLFHRSIVEATHNGYFIDLNEHLDHSVRKLIRQARLNTSKYSHDLVNEVFSEHAEIFENIKRGNCDGAALAAENHLRQAAKRMNVYLNA